jgi:general L-amino acid transport system ATP-binding protein
MSSQPEGAAPDLQVSDELIIKIKDMHKWYGSFHVLRDVNLDVYRGERIVICGPSGSGKSTLIRCINRLEEHQQGDIIVENVELTNDLKNIDAIRREVGMCFQHFNLFPHLTVLENCSLAPIWVKQVPRKEAEATAMKYLERVKIPEQADKFPGQLSGGQQQRVAIARSLCMNPKIMLSRRHGRTRQGRYDDVVCNPRNGICQDRCEPGHIHGWRPDHRRKQSA